MGSYDPVKAGMLDEDERANLLPAAAGLSNRAPTAPPTNATASATAYYGHPVSSQVHPLYQQAPVPTPENSFPIQLMM